MQHLVSNEKNMRWMFFPLGVWAMQQLDVTGYDVVLISSTYGAKYVKISSTSLVITYCYTPFRLIWAPYSYKQYLNAKGLSKIAFDFVIKTLRKIDYRAAQRSNHFVAMTAETRERIRNAYHYTKEIPLIKPPVNCDAFYVSEQTKDYYLIVSRLESYKKVDMVIEAFNQLGHQLIIVGRGSQETELKNKARGNITFKSGINSKEIAKLYAHCKALIFPQHEDYGITPLEANASGRPVIAYGQGGVLDTMIPVNNVQDASKATAIFFYKQDAESLIKTINQFENLRFNPAFIRRHAESFDESMFIAKIQQYVNHVVDEHSFVGKSIVS
jgi:glycosyltransferase involved in cell wall biosynthesis